MNKKMTPLIAASLLNVMFASCSEAATPSMGTGGNGSSFGSSAAVPAELQGDWQAGGSAPIGYYDPNSSMWQGATGSSFILKLHADGTYQYTGLLAVGGGSCQSMVLSTEQGRVGFDGARMTFTPDEGDVQSTVCNGPVKHTPVTPSVRRWALSVDDYGKKALFTCLQDGSGAATTFYRTDTQGKTYQKTGIRGTVTAPQGYSVAGTLIVVCYVDDATCSSPATRIQAVTGSGGIGTFTFPALEDRAYALSAIQDVNHNGTVDAGDLVDVYSTNEAPGTRPSVLPPADNVSLDSVQVK